MPVVIGAEARVVRYAIIWGSVRRDADALLYAPQNKPFAIAIYEPPAS